MARIRTIKPEFFTSEDIVSLDPLARLLYIGLWCEADKEGRFPWKPATFKLRYLPADDCDIDALCDALVTRGLVVLYGEKLAYIPRFKDHQHINPRETPSKLPAPDSENSRASDASVTRREEGKGRERKEHASRNAFDAGAIDVPEGINKTSWVEWVEFRKSRKKPVSEHAAKLNFKMLLEYSQDVQAQIIHKSIQNDYQGLFPPDDHGRHQPPEQPQRRLQEL